MKKKNTFLGVALLIAVLMLGIGYAATAQVLKVTGTATGVYSQENFNVVFESAKAGDYDGNNAEGVTASIDTANDETSRTAVMTVELGKLNSIGSANFVIKNDSAAGIAATINANNVRITDETGNELPTEYFLITTDFPSGETILAVGETIDFTVNVQLIKAVVNEEESVQQQFRVNLEGFLPTAE